MKHASKLFVATALLASTAAVSHAQTAVATVAISALVNSSLSASSPNALSFGSVVQGDGPTVIDPSLSAAGRVNIAGGLNQGVTITMTTLPSVLTNGAATLGISAYRYCYLQNAGQQATCSSAAIAQGGTVSGQALSNSGQGYLFIGATLAGPSATQTTGAYSGTMTITITSP